MLSRIRGFNQELTGRIEEATAALAKQNHDLAELNDLLVAARRDLTAKERLAALGQLAGTIAHELGNPLNSISGHVQLLERSPNLPDEVRDDLELISSEVRRMTDVIRRFLDSTRGLRPAPEQVDLGSLVSEALDMSLSAEARARLTVEKRVSPGLDGIITDPSLVRHVLTNLIANAVDAMPAGGKLDLSAQTRDGELYLSVRDTGTGIVSEDRRRIFEPFYTTKARGKGTRPGARHLPRDRARLEGTHRRRDRGRAWLDVHAGGALPARRRTGARNFCPPRPRDRAPQNSPAGCRRRPRLARADGEGPLAQILRR